MKTYCPQPIDTSGITLSPKLQLLMERLAKNTHDVWARQRIAEGWIYGKERNDKLKHHPCLISYDLLPDSEKQYDRDTAEETLKVILEMGYEIIDPS